MKLICILVVLAALASSAPAAPERITTGPYTVSFDLNTAMNYTVGILPPKDLGNYTKYQIVASTNNSSWASIAIDDYKDLQDSNIKDELRFRTLLHDKDESSNAFERAIDGRTGVFNNITRPNGDQFSDAFYWLDSRKCECGPVYVGRVSIEVLSTYPQDMVESLLGTINVSSENPEPAQAAASVPVQPSAQTGTQAPAAAPSGIVPAIVVANQNPVSGTVVIQEVDSDGLGFAAIHASLNGAPGAVLGYAPVRSGVNRNVVVRINTAGATNPLFAVLHQDQGTIGAFEDGIDLPSRYRGDVVARLFSIRPASTASQEIEGLPASTMDFLSDNWISGYEKRTYTMY